METCNVSICSLDTLAFLAELRVGASFFLPRLTVVSNVDAPSDPAPDFDLANFDFDGTLASDLLMIRTDDGGEEADVSDFRAVDVLIEPFSLLRSAAADFDPPLELTFDPPIDGSAFTGDGTGTISALVLPSRPGVTLGI